MTSFIIRRLSTAIFAVWGVLTITFLIVRLLPGDPAKLMLGLYASEELIQEQRKALGLDRPLMYQYGLYLKQVLSGNWGKSLLSQQPVHVLIATSFSKTFVLACSGLFVALALALPLGVWTGKNASSASSRFLAAFCLLGQSIAPFWLGIVLILVFARWAKLLPSFGFGGFSHLVLPSLTVGLPLVGTIVRLLRAELAWQLAQDYIRTARAKGLPEHIVVLRHGFRNALISTLTIIGLQFGSLLAGSIVTETVFAWPGLGRVMIDALSNRDYPVIQISVILTASVYVLVNLVIDIIIGLLDPRIQYD